MKFYILIILFFFTPTNTLSKEETNSTTTMDKLEKFLNTGKFTKMVCSLGGKNGMSNKRDWWKISCSNLTQHDQQKTTHTVGKLNKEKWRSQVDLNSQSRQKSTPSKTKTPSKLNLDFLTKTIEENRSGLQKWENPSTKELNDLGLIGKLRDDIIHNKSETPSPSQEQESMSRQGELSALKNDCEIQDSDNESQTVEGFTEVVECFSSD